MSDEGREGVMEGGREVEREKETGVKVRGKNLRGVIRKVIMR